MTGATHNAIWLCPDQLFDGQRLTSGSAISVVDGICAAIVPVDQVPGQHERIVIDGIVAPGFVDLQVNGGGGRLINSEPTSECMQAIAAVHKSLGTVAILPTVITDRREVLERAVEAAIDARGSDGVAGLHIEGPHISNSRRGTHATEYIRPLRDDTLALVGRLRDADIPVMITLAPEAATSAQISALDEMGAVVSLGHSDAGAATTRAAFDAGARSVTHLFNAMSPMQNREPGLTGAAINSTAYAGVICDGVHVADEMVGLAFRAKTVADRMFLVSDAMPTVGGPTSFKLYGQEIQLRRGRLVNSEGSLAGAHTTVAAGVARLVNVVGLDPETALRAAIHVPSTLMGLDLDHVIGRSAGDLLHLDAQLNLLGPAYVPSSVQGVAARMR